MYDLQQIDALAVRTPKVIDMAPNTNPKEIKFDAGGFEYKGTRHIFADVAHLRFARMQKGYYIGFVTESMKIGTDESVGLNIEMHSGEILQFIEKPGTAGMLAASREEMIEAIINAYSTLSRVTFDGRMACYLEDAEKRGYFMYSGFRFYPSRRVISRDGREFTLENTNFLRAYGYIELRDKNYGLLQKMKREILGSKITAIDTLTDTDVIFTILAHFFGLRWT